MSASTLATYNGRLTAQQRANDAWGLPELPEEEEAFFRRLDQALCQTEEKAPVVSDVPRDPYKWRRKFMKRFGTRCPKCLGVGMVPSYKWAHHDDFMECPLCGPLRFDTVPKVDPADHSEDDFEEIAF